MAKVIKKKKRALKKSPDALHLKLAFSLGRTVKKVSKTVSAARKPSQKRLQEEAEPLSPILKEIKAVCDISGLTAAIEEMNEISMDHSDHPLINQLASRIGQLSPYEQEMLSRKFIEKLSAHPCFSGSLAGNFSSPSKITEEDCQNVSDAFIESVFYALEDVGMTVQERRFLQRFSDDMTRPINDLVQFYLHPKTFSQKVKRLWRMQRIIIKMIKLIHMTNALAAAGDGSAVHFRPLHDPSVILLNDQSVVSK